MSGFGNFIFGVSGFGFSPSSSNQPVPLAGFADVQAILASLPPSFKRLGPNFTVWQNSQVAALSRMVEAVNSLSAQYSFTGSTGNWLNAWGELFGVPRQTQTDIVYQLCITLTLLAWRGTVPGIERYINEAKLIPSTVIENFPSVGWQLSIAPGFQLSASQIQLLPSWLAFVRPAGIPYVVRNTGGQGGYLSTGNFISITKYPGSWLRLRGGSPNGFVIPTSTNNSISQLPVTFFTDPLLNPSLSSVPL